MIEKMVPYEFGGRKFAGAIVYDDSVAGKRPAIFMQPDWFGVCPHTIEMARVVAGKDYVVLLVDMFGADFAEKEKTTEDLMKSSRAARNDLDFLFGCGAAADAALTAEATALGVIDPGPKFAIGYCIGAGIALEQARAGADFKATVAFHSTLPNPVDPNATPNFKGRVLVVHGSADPVAPKGQIDALEAELTDAKVDWQVVMFGHAGHAFCVKEEGVDNPRYDEKLCNQSYRLMRDFFSETP